ncbi:ABC transporter permease [Sinomicrobium weinanense]|uniref:ABC transporter permease n=1 Tax=Sinomicrobium weinanense TaxID=2842200 RepID=A0A926JP60_9FLAO|nr:ABC transporter permease [Sinomicrobium weinanense]MBC9794748.1 ABC transporter permease [Sinomicrobium weinanense]MBU3125007.1 ABC transporter permease [Sinomicrobium weinanense]
MIRTYIKTAWRNILKNKGVFSLNIAGLSIGIACCLLIVLFVTDELSYDKFHEKADNIVRVVFRAKVNGEVIKEAVVMAPVAQTLKEELPEVLDATRIRRIWMPKMRYENTTYRDSRFAYVDPNFFDIFTLPVIKGNQENPLKEPGTIVLTRDEARKYFGNSNPIGKMLVMGDAEEQFRVTAVIENIPENSHFHFDMFASMEGYPYAKNTFWTKSDFFTYLLLREGTDPELLEDKLPPIVESHMGPQMKDEIGMSFAEFTKDNQLGLFLQPLTDIHLNSDFANASELEQGGNIKYIYIFGAIGLFMLLIACINFMNLSTATAAKRTKEVGIRKVLGSERKQLISQFLTESLIATLIAMVIGFFLVILALPFFNNLSGKALNPAFLLKFRTGAVLLVMMAFISLTAGGYPAFFLSSFKPVAALKSKFFTGKGTKGLRSGLVVFQFVISAGLIFATLVVGRQMSYIQNKNVGYDRDQILVLRDAHLLGHNKTAFKNEILKDPRVKNVTTSAYVPAGPTNNSMSGVFLGDRYQRRMHYYNIDEEYLSVMGMELVAGRNFSKVFGADSLNVIINETAVETLGFKDNPIGKTLTRANDKGGEELTVIGVVRDFHFKSLHQPIEPLILRYNSYGGLILRTTVADMSGLIESIQKLWNRFDSGEPFTYAILDDSYKETYRAEQKMGDILRIFALLTIFVACLGLFGLVTFTTEQRLKEIGIRKVLGSSVAQIVTLLSKDFLKLILLSFVIAFPIGYYFMDRWLRDFSYRTDIRWWVFVLAALITVFIALVTISFKSVKAALENPVKSLKTE